jgi:hypothetical protein
MERPCALNFFLSFVVSVGMTDRALYHSRVVSAHSRPLIRAFPVISNAYACHQCANA